MMPVPLNPDTRRRVVASARLLMSDKPGEVVAASRALTAMLAKAGLDLGNILALGLDRQPVLQPHRYLTKLETRRFAERLGVRT